MVLLLVGHRVHGQDLEMDRAHLLFERSKELDGSNREPERLELLLQAEAAITPATDPRVQWGIHRRLSDLLANYHALDLSHKQRMAELKVVQDLLSDDLERPFFTYRAMGWLHHELGHPDSAKIYMLRSLQAVPDNFPRYHAGAYNSLALLHMRLGEMGPAERYLDSGEAVLGDREPELMDVRFSIRDNRADIALARGRAAEACELVRQNVAILRAGLQGDPDMMDRYERYSIKLADLWLDAGLFAEAQQVIGDLKADLPFLREDFRERGRSDLLAVEHRLYQQTGDLMAQARIVPLLLQDRDSSAQFRDRDRVRSMAAITQLAVEQKRREMASQVALEQERTRNAEARAKARSTIAGLIAVFSVLVLAGVVLLFRARIRRKQAEQRLVEQELAFRRKDLQGMAMDLGRKQQWTRQLLDATYALEEAPPKEVPERIKQLESNMQAELRIDEQREWIARNIQEVNSAFYQRLQEAHPGLAPTEVELCGMVRAGLTNAAIADLRHISIASARTARYRLKGKLGIGKDEDLVEALKEL